MRCFGAGMVNALLYDHRHNGDGDGIGTNGSGNSVQDWMRGLWNLLKERHAVPYFT